MKIGTSDWFALANAHAQLAKTCCEELAEAMLDRPRQRLEYQASKLRSKQSKLRDLSKLSKPNPPPCGVWASSAKLSTA